MKRQMKLGKPAALAAIAAVVALTMACAGGESSVIKQRQEAMEDIGKSMKALATIAKKQAPFDASVVKSNAETIADRLNTAAGLFPEGSDSGDIETDAKPEIWSDRAGFDKALENAHSAAVAMQSVTDEEAFGPALGALGNGCKSCHDTYRLPQS